jgi:hypothetical protein
VTFTVTVEGTQHAIGPGETLFIARGKVHGFDNRSGADAVCLGVLTPGVLGPEYFREVSELVAKGPPDETVMREIMLRYGLVPLRRARLVEGLVLLAGGRPYAHGRLDAHVRHFDADVTAMDIAAEAPRQQERRHQPSCPTPRQALPLPPWLGGNIFL